MDVLFSMGRATGQEIRERLHGEPSYSSVRTILRILETKGHVRHVEEGLRYVYLPAVEREQAKKSAIERLVHTFFNGSTKAAAAAFIDSGLPEEDLKELEQMIRAARREKESA